MWLLFDMVLNISTIWVGKCSASDFIGFKFSTEVFNGGKFNASGMNKISCSRRGRKLSKILLHNTQVEQRGA